MIPKRIMIEILDSSVAKEAIMRGILKVIEEAMLGETMLEEIDFHHNENFCLDENLNEEEEPCS